VCVCVCGDAKWRNPDLREVIDYLSHEDDLIKANAAAYLQHLTYMDDNIKAETRLFLRLSMFFNDYCAVWKLFFCAYLPSYQHICYTFKC